MYSWFLWRPTPRRGPTDNHLASKRQALQDRAAFGIISEGAPRRRFELTDAYQRIEHLLAGKPTLRGATARDKRLLIDAMLWIARTVQHRHRSLFRPFPAED